jgi:uncharacterized tellurite resistance protein B-like protein
MGFFNSVFKLLLSDKDFAKLDDEQNLAVLDLLCLMQLADGRVSDEEERSLRGEFLRLPWAWSLERAAVDERVRASQSRLMSCTEEERTEAVRSAARKLPEGTLRETVALMLIQLAYADGVEDRELGLLDVYGKEVGIDAAAMKKLIGRVGRDLGGT